MTWGVYAYAFFQDLIPLYPVYALLFADTGATDGQISALFALWTLVAFTFEVPSGLLADRWARRPLVAAAPLLAGAAFALWTLFPSFPVFAAGFVLWGAGGALGSGAFQALVYDTLAAAGRTSDYPRLIGRSRALATGAMLASGLLTGPLLLIGGYAAVGAASVAACVLAALAAGLLPETPRHRPVAGEQRQRGAWSGAWTRLRHTPALVGVMGALAALTVVDALDEYLPLLARATGAADWAVAPLVVLVSAGTALGQWCAGRGTRWTGPILCAGVLLLVAGALSGHPAGMVGVAAGFGAGAWAAVAVENRMHEQVSSRVRATVASLAEAGRSVVALLVYAAYGTGALWAGPGLLFALLVVPCLAVGVWLSVWRL